MNDFQSPLGSYMESFLRYREAFARKNSAYLPILQRLDRFCKENYPHETSLNQEMVMRWMGLTNTWLPNRGAIVRKFAMYMNGMGGVAYVLPMKMYGQNSSFVPYIFTDDELARLFSAIDAMQPTKHQPFADKVLPVLFRLIYTCGLRPNEGRLLKARNVFLDSGEVLISETKGNKERIVVMSADMRTLCSDYNDSRPLFGTESEYFFSGSDGYPFSSTWLLKQLRRCWSNANPSILLEELPSVRVYDLRHRFASAAIQRWLDAGVDLNAKLPFLRTYMGHSKLSQTAYYIHLLPGNLTATNAVNWAAFEKLIPEVEP